MIGVSFRSTLLLLGSPVPKGVCALKDASFNIPDRFSYLEQKVEAFKAFSPVTDRMDPVTRGDLFFSADLVGMNMGDEGAGSNWTIQRRRLSRFAFDW
jgi:hypothetical protein